VFKDKIITEGLWNAGENADSMWNKMSIRIQKVVIEVFRVIRGNRRKPKDTLW
jgi:hypothetical protein